MGSNTRLSPRASLGRLRGRVSRPAQSCPIEEHQLTALKLLFNAVLNGPVVRIAVPSGQ